MGRQPLLRRCLERRPWWERGQIRSKDIVFVLRDTQRSRRFAQESLAAWYPEARSIMLVSATTGGAALSALAGLALVGQDEQPRCASTWSTSTTARPSIPCGAPRKPVSDSRRHSCSPRPIRSTAICVPIAAGNVVEAAEKRAISSHASAGTYFFASTAIYLAGAGA